MLSTERPIFVGGVAKSGTTLVGHLLSNHPTVDIDYDIGPSLHFLRYARDAANDHFFFSNENPPSPMWKRNQHWLKDDRREWHLLNMDYFQSMHRGYGRAHRWGSSTCATYQHRKLLFKWYPNATFVIVKRDPRDLWCSHRKLVNPNIDNKWDDFIKTYSSLPTENEKGIKVIEYHDVVTRPELVFTLFDLDIPQNYLSGVQEVFLARTLGSDPRLWKSELGEGLIRSRIGKWQRELSPREIRMLELAFPEECEYYDKVTP